MVTSPGHSQQPVSPQDFFLMAWLANVTTRFFSHGSCQMPPQDFLTVAAICFLAHSPQRGNTVTSWYSGEFWCWINPAVSLQDFFRQGRLAHVTTGFFSTEPARPCHHKIFICPDPDGLCHHKIFISHFKITILWRGNENPLWRDALL